MTYSRGKNPSSLKHLQKGHYQKHSEESKQKMREASIRLGLKPPSRKGISLKLSEEHKEKIRQFLTGRKRPEISGEKCHLWKGGITPYYKIIRKTRLSKAGGFHSKKEWENMKAQYNWTCPCCKKSEPKITLSKDHIIPVSKGGSDNIENIQPLCRICNSRKNVKVIRYEYSLIQK